MESNFRSATTMQKHSSQLETRVNAAQEILGGILKIRQRLEEMHTRVSGSGSVDRLRVGENGQGPVPGMLATLRQAQEMSMEEVERIRTLLDELEQLV